jgi:hypothetical protein
VYIRWLRYDLTTRQGATRIAVLVESSKVGGKSRQRYIGYLGSCVERGSPAARLKFWNAVTERLNRLGRRVPPADRATVEAALAERVPRPTRAQLRGKAPKRTRRGTRRPA